MYWICAENSVDNTGMFVTAEQCLHRAKAFSASHPTPPVSRQGVHKELGGDTARTADPNDQRDIPYHMTSRSAYKAGGRRRKRGDIQSDGVCLPKSPLCVMEPCFPGDG